MPRQPTLSPDDMRALFIDCAEQAIAQEGLKQATARNIATRAGYTAGTLYTCFRNLDDLLTHVQIRVLERLRTKIKEAHETSSPANVACNVARAYIAFAAENHQLWTLIQATEQSGHDDIDQEFVAALNATRTEFASALANQKSGNGHNSPNPSSTADVLWSSIHGLTGIANSRKSAVFTTAEINTIVDTLCDRLAS